MNGAFYTTHCLDRNPPPMRRTIILLAVVLSACTEFPALDGTIDPALANAPYPALVPLGPVLAQADAGADGAGIRGAAGVEPALSARLAGLRARANGLRGPVIPAEARARMLRAVR